MLDKHGERHTIIGVELEPNDIVAAMNGLLRHYEWEARRNEAVKRGLGRIYDLTALHREDAPSLDELLDVVQSMSSHCLFRPLDEEPPMPAWADNE